MPRIVVELESKHLDTINQTATTLGVGTSEALIYIIEQHVSMRSRLAAYVKTALVHNAPDPKNHQHRPNPRNKKHGPHIPRA